MSKDPAFLLYSSDFLIGCAEFTHEEIGQYFRILCYMHQKGRMNEKTIWFLVGSVLEKVKSKFSIDENGFWYNEKFENVIAERQNWVNSRKSNGSKGGRPKKEKPYGLATDNHMEDEDINTNVIINKEKKEEISPPEELQSKPGFPEAWEDWKEYRKETKKKLTKKTIEKQIKFLKEQPDPSAVINQSIQNGWQGLFELKTSTYNGKQNGANTPNRGSVQSRVNYKHDPDYHAKRERELTERFG